MRKMEVGDWVYYPNMGAYTTVAASKFNGFDKPKVYHIIDHYNWLVYFSSRVRAIALVRLFFDYFHEFPL